MEKLYEETCPFPKIENKNIIEVDEQSFVDKAHIVKNAGWGCSTNFHLALDKILEVLSIFSNLTNPLL